MDRVRTPADQHTAMDAWLVRNCGVIAPLGHHQIAGGWSNVTTLVTDATGRHLVVREPPSGSHAGGAHDVLREASIMAALAATKVPVPAVLGKCDDPSVAPLPFSVMEYVEGPVVHSVDTMLSLAPRPRRRLGLQLMDLLSSLQEVDIDSVGLSGLRRSQPYLERQMRRWKAQWAALATRELPALHAVTARLEQVLPTLRPTKDCLVHGDFRFGNVIVKAGTHPTIAALLDWELTTTGHPLADLGYLGARMSAPAGVLKDDADPSSAEGCPDFETLVARFATLTGQTTDELPVFVALSAWRWAIIAAGVQSRFAGRRMGALTENADWHRSRVELLIRLAQEWIAC